MFGGGGLLTTQAKSETGAATTAAYGLRSSRHRHQYRRSAKSHARRLHCERPLSISIRLDPANTARGLRNVRFFVDISDVEIAERISLLATALATLRAVA